MQLNFDVAREVSKVLVCSENRHGMPLRKRAKQEIRMRSLNSFGTTQSQNGGGGFIILGFYGKVIEVLQFGSNPFKFLMYGKPRQNFHTDHSCQHCMAIIQELVQLGYQRNCF